MNPMLEGLYRQHREAEELLKRLAAAARRLGSEGPAADVLAELGACRERLQGEVDSHFREEERGLFPILGRHLGLDDGPIAAMMEEHAQLRQLQLTFEGSLAALESGERGEWAGRLVEAAEGIGRALPPHITKEDEVIFPMAADVLSEAEWAQCRTLWARASELVP
jgi:regulator of cell morphogenesis and NO signaling